MENGFGLFSKSLVNRYLKTTLFGLTGCSPDYVMLIVGGNAGLIGMSKVRWRWFVGHAIAYHLLQEHLGVALALHVPVIVRGDERDVESILTSAYSTRSVSPRLARSTVKPLQSSHRHDAQIDMTPAHVLEQTVKQLNKVLKSQGVR